MSNYHLEVKNISKCKNRSFVRLTNYITGERLNDEYNGKTYYDTRNDVLFHCILLPPTVPCDFRDLQTLCTKIDQAEKRYDARTTREFIGSLPNELSYADLIKITYEFVQTNFVEHELAAIIGIHSGINREDSSKNNPHAHILVSTRQVDAYGFSKHKYREFNKKSYITIWRESWAELQNRAYRNRGLDIMVSSDSLEVQGLERETLKNLSLAAYRLEQKGVRTSAGDENRAIKMRNAERVFLNELKHIHNLERSR